MIRFRRAVSCLLTATFVLPAAAQTVGDSNPILNSEIRLLSPTPARPKVVLVLSGGGARGAAHIGVLKVLEDLHVPVDAIVGTSMGSIVGGLYASGWSTQEIEQKVETIDWGAVFVDKLPRRYRTYRRKQDDVYLIPIKMRFKNWKPYLPPSVVGGQSLELLMQGLEIQATGETDFSKFPIPYKAVAADLSNGTPFVIDHGSLATAMRASMSVPGVFPPVEIDGKPLCDGGIAANFPIRVARSLGDVTIIGVDITSPLSPSKARGNLLQRLDQVTSLMTALNKIDDVAASLPRDVLMTPELGDISFSDFKRAKEAVIAGEKAARSVEDRLKALAVSDADWAAYTAKHERRPASELVVDKVHIVNTSFLDSRVVERRVNVPTGKPLDEEDLSKQVLNLYGLDTFGTIHHDLTRKDGSNVLTLETPKKPYGRNSLQFGANFEDDFHGGVTFNLAASHLLNPLNRLGGEWRNVIQIGDNARLGTEFYQPIDTRMAWFVDSTVSTGRDKITLYDTEGDALAEYTVRVDGAQAGIGRNFKNWGQWEVGVFRSHTTATPRIASTGFPRDEFDDGGVLASVRADTFDSYTWPTHGLRVDATYGYGLDAFGADVQAGYAKLAVAEARSIGKNVVFGSVELGASQTDQLDIRTSFFLGGFLRLSGLQNRELIGQDGGLARLLYYRELTSFSIGSLAQRVFAGASLEAGGVYNAGDPITWPSLRGSASVFAGADTILGPAYLGFGYSEGGRTAVYLILGQRF
jgi:NTE family protein